MAVEREVNRIICAEHGIDMVYEDTIFWDFQSQEFKDEFNRHAEGDIAIIGDALLIRLPSAGPNGGRIIYSKYQG